MRSVVHVSDLHFGRVDEGLLSPLASRIADLAPHVVVVSGDLTQRARVSQFAAARAFLNRLPHPQIIVPGNHDVPLYDVLRRFLAPLHRYRTYITDDLEPFYGDEEIAVIGINTSRSLTFKGGRINEQQIEQVRSRMSGIPDGVVKIMVTHHPFDVPSSDDQDGRVGRAHLAMSVLANAGVDVLLSGHLHTSHSGSTGERFGSSVRPVVLVQAGTATSTRARGESNAFNHLRIESGRLEVQRYEWQDGSGTFAPTQIEHYEERDAGWTAVAHG
jgi:3',5'-cyclic AMP phosphodiesterase CpdA